MKGRDEGQGEHYNHQFYDCSPMAIYTIKRNAVMLSSLSCFKINNHHDWSLVESVAKRRKIRITIK